MDSIHSLLHGVPEHDDEDTDALFRNIISKHLGIQIRGHHLDRTPHRIGPKRVSGSVRPIIAKFTRYNKRASVFRRKSKLKGTGFILTESLTKRRVAALNAARKEFGNKNVWTRDGKIIASKDRKTVLLPY